MIMNSRTAIIIDDWPTLYSFRLGYPPDPGPQYERLLHSDDGRELLFTENPR